MGMSDKGAEQATGLQVPQLELFVCAAASENLAVGAEGYGEHPGCGVEYVERLAVGELPYPDGFIETTARKQLAVGIEGYGSNAAHMSGKRTNRLSAKGVPSSHSVVRGAANEELTVGAECHGVNLIRVPG